MAGNRQSSLGRILPYLQSKSWETRQAASEAVDAICKAVGIWDPSVTETHDDATSNSVEASTSASSIHKLDNQINTQRNNRLTYQNFKLETVLSECLILLASAGKEFDHQSNHLRSGESLFAAQRDVTNKLGLGGLCRSNILDFKSMGVDDPTQEHHNQDQAQNSSQVSTPNPQEPHGATPNPTNPPRQPPSAPSETYPSATPGPEATGLSALGLSESPRPDFVASQPSHPPTDHFELCQINTHYPNSLLPPHPPLRPNYQSRTWRVCQLVNAMRSSASKKLSARAMSDQYHDLYLALLMLACQPSPQTPPVNPRKPPNSKPLNSLPFPLMILTGAWLYLHLHL
ncbi:hypothetical protein PCANC_27822 [Puccinia coronata f. sp. avenae]|uniref:Uncharacterized protein n=1 Tax=Puccinia coronata f. sp. avenae TaxID=200324 RepID=A0A2N5S0X8_9BASI|nr:hypothetical protein PCANC_27822 [Puccinia coronata f. sp. avenae]